METKSNKAIKNRQQAGWTYAALLGLRFIATLAQTNQYSSGLLWRRYVYPNTRLKSETPTNVDCLYIQ